MEGSICNKNVTENSTQLLPVHNLMVVQKLEAQHDAGGVESAGGEDENVKLGPPSQTNPIKYATEQRDAFRDRRPTVSSHCRLEPQRHLQPHDGSCCVTVEVQNMKVPRWKRDAITRNDHQ